ncbi:hypothetical protein HPB51_007822 [Rhipicephalus microplus]|uniref:Uncharacterized protein n=1 Tax=Rhipicephalus microplus TaxID=6941 RepID=A0A9J6EYM2_RHIMP|nr:hypothetical protein HPB51_007822 [Rhipicephalus microplus]
MEPRLTLEDSVSILDAEALRISVSLPLPPVNPQKLMEVCQKRQVSQLSVWSLGSDEVRPPGRERLYTTWIAGGQHQLNPGRKIKRPPVEMLCAGIVEPGHAISVEVVRKSFKKTGISNALDASENDMVWSADDLDTENESPLGDDECVLSNSDSE